MQKTHPCRIRHILAIFVYYVYNIISVTIQQPASRTNVILGRRSHQGHICTYYTSINREIDILYLALKLVTSYWLTIHSKGTLHGEPALSSRPQPRRLHLVQLIPHLVQFKLHLFQPNAPPLLYLLLTVGLSFL